MREVKVKNGGTFKVLEKGETANPNGRPKKGISLVNAELKEKGYEPAKKSDVEATYLSLLQLEEEALKELINDKSKPMLVRILVKNMLSGKGFDIIEKMLDRGIGKPVSPVSGDLDLKGITLNFNRGESPFINEGNKSIPPTT